MPPRPDANSWRGRRVLVTGHTGFKGRWLTRWLAELGAEVHGLADAPAGGTTDHLRGTHEIDVRAGEAVAGALAASSPEVVFHLAAQAIVRRSLVDPVGTWATNVVGTANVLHALPDATRAVVVVTSDKCYRDVDSGRPMREDDALGGRDPYSASKAGQELVAHAARETRLRARGVQVATARAGNVIGGGDEAADRLVPDLVRAARAGRPLVLRNPDAVRPWQHVVNPLSGYLVLAERLLARDGFDEAWNFGPAPEDERPVRWVAERLAAAWPDATPEVRAEPDPDAGQETAVLRLDSAKAAARLGWTPPLDLEGGLAATVRGYAGEDPRTVIAAL